MTKKSSEEIAKRVLQVQEGIVQAAGRAGRSAQEITLLGVTKTQSAEHVHALIEAGVSEIGENKVQELLEKEPFLTDIPHKTHLIGHLQRNKAKFLPTHVDMLQSLDSVKLLETLERVYEGSGEILDVLIEVNIGEESNKNGVFPAELDDLAQRVMAAKYVRLRGLMAIPPFGLGEKVRVYFERMNQLFIDIKRKKMDNNTVNILSMGMSADFEYAILEGATMVRVGTDLFGPRV